MRKTLINIDLLLINFLCIYFIVRLSGDDMLNTFLDSLMNYVTNDIQFVIAVIIGVFIPLDKVKDVAVIFKSQVKKG